MRHILVLNAKGGCGKSTIATNLAAWFSGAGNKTALVDYDPQRSSLDWLERRPDYLAPIIGIPGYEHGLRGVPRNTDIAIMDAPARSHGKELSGLLRNADTLVIPVLASTIDMQAASVFIDELKKQAKVVRKDVRIGLVANRVREYTLIFDELDEYLTRMRLPYVAHLREAQNYIRAYSRGLGIHELPEYLAWPDWAQWEPLEKWLRSKRSQP